MCLVLVYSLAGATVCETVPRVDVFSHHAVLSQQATFIVDNLPLKQAFITGFLRYVYPEKDKNDIYTWPPYFLDRWEREKTNPKYSNATFRRRSAGKFGSNPTEKDILYYGWCNHIHDEYNKSRAVITATLNKMWVPERQLKSGMNVPSLHKTIRKFWYNQWALDTAKHFVVTNKSTRKGKGEAALSTLELEELQDGHFELLMGKFDFRSLKSYPKQWLAFLFIGKPDYIGMGTKNAFNSGLEVQIKTNVPRSIANAGM